VPYSLNVSLKWRDIVSVYSTSLVSFEILATCTYLVKGEIRVTCTLLLQGETFRLLFVSQPSVSTSKETSLPF
jgi:hypothetical protein